MTEDWCLSGSQAVLFVVPSRHICVAQWLKLLPSMQEALVPSPAKQLQKPKGGCGSLGKVQGRKGRSPYGRLLLSCLTAVWLQLSSRKLRAEK